MNKRARTSVDMAIKESEIMIRCFLLNLSAHTPAKGDRKNVGKKPHIMAMVIIMPDWVFIVIYHVMAY
jgi:hypothetical protein